MGSGAPCLGPVLWCQCVRRLRLLRQDGGPVGPGQSEGGGLWGGSGSLGGRQPQPSPAPINGRHLVRVTPNGNMATVSIKGEVKTDTNNSLPYSKWSDGQAEGGTSYYPPSYNNNGPTSAHASANVTATANYDGRDVTISADIEPTWKKGKVADRVGYPVQDQWGNDVYEPVPNKPDSDGTGHGDVGLAASPQSVMIPTPSDSYLYVTYKGRYAGGWHIPGLMEWWNSSLTNTPANDTLIESLDASSFVAAYIRPSDPQVIGYDPYDGTPLYSQAVPGKTGTDHIYLKCEDAAPSSGSGGDGAFATANYYMNVHDEWENPFKSHSDPPFWKDVKIDDPAPVAHSGDNVPFTYTTDGASTDGNIIGDAGWTFLFNAAPGWLQGIMKVAGLDDNIKPTHIPGVTDFYGVWHTDGNGATWSNSNTRPDDSQMSNYRLNYRLQRRYLSTWVRADHYVMPGDASGYTGFAGQRDQHFTALDTRPAGTQGTGEFVWDIQP